MNNNIKKCNIESVTYEVVEEKPKGFGVRYVQAFLMFLSLTIGYSMRVIMGVAIVAMTDQATEEKGIMVFDWSKKMQDVILSSFFWGYTCMQIPGGQIAHRYGAKQLLVLCLLINGGVGMLIPISARWAGWKAVCVCRVVQGLAQGSLIPSLHTLQGKWAPFDERSRISTMIYGGSHAGSIFAMAFSGFLAASSYGWPLIFYTCGIANILCAFMWFCFGAESPAKHKKISPEEKRYIQESLGQTDKRMKMSVPWKIIFSSGPVWAIIASHMGSSWVHVILFTEVPSYLNKVMNVDIKSNGLLSALPFLGMWLGGIGFGFISDFFINKKIFSLTVARKIGNTIGMWGSAVGFLMLAFVPRNSVILATSALIFASTAKSCTHVGYFVNHLDISPNFAGTLISISNMVSNGFGVMAPITAGLILKDERDPHQWRIVFFILIGIVFVANLIYIFLASAKKVAWNEPEYFACDMKAMNKEKMNNKEVINKSDI